MGRKKIEHDNLKFDNEYEINYYNYLKSKGYNFQYQKKVELLEKSEFGDPISWNLDYYIKDLDLYIDIKGLNREADREHKLKKRIFKELYGDKIYFIAEAPKWYQKQFGAVWIEYESKNKLEVLVRAFKKKLGISRINDKIDLSELVEKIKDKKLLPFDKA